MKKSRKSVVVVLSILISVLCVAGVTAMYATNHPELMNDMLKFRFVIV